MDQSFSIDSNSLQAGLDTKNRSILEAKLERLHAGTSAAPIVFLSFPRSIDKSHPRIDIKIIELSNHDGSLAAVIGLPYESHSQHGAIVTEVEKGKECGMAKDRWTIRGAWAALQIKGEELVCIVDGLSSDYLQLSQPEKTIAVLANTYKKVTFLLGDPYIASEARTQHSSRMTS